MNEPLLSTQEVANLHHCSVSVVEKAARSGRLPATRVGKSWVIAQSAAAAFKVERGRGWAAYHRRIREESTPTWRLSIPGEGAE